jgi:hypothetical protein
MYSLPICFLSLIAFGGYSNGDHLFPFRTEKLSPFAQMVLPYKVGEYVAAIFMKTRPNRRVFSFYTPAVSDYICLLLCNPDFFYSYCPLTFCS